MSRMFVPPSITDCHRVCCSIMVRMWESHALDSARWPGTRTIFSRDLRNFFPINNWTHNNIIHPFLARNLHPSQASRRWQPRRDILSKQFDVPLCIENGMTRTLSHHPSLSVLPQALTILDNFKGSSQRSPSEKESQTQNTSSLPKCGLTTRVVVACLFFEDLVHYVLDPRMFDVILSHLFPNSSSQLSLPFSSTSLFLLHHFTFFDRILDSFINIITFNCRLVRLYTIALTHSQILSFWRFFNIVHLTRSFLTRATLESLEDIQQEQ